MKKKIKKFKNSIHAQLLSLSNQAFCNLIYMLSMNYSLYYYNECSNTISK